MIHPLAPFTMRGIIWYQGESNSLKGDTTIYTDRTLPWHQDSRKFRETYLIRRRAESDALRVCLRRECF